MLSSLLITLREGLEIALVVVIILAYLKKTGRSDRWREVWLGAAIAALLCIVTGFAFHRLVGEFEGRWEQAIEGTLALVASGVLTWMIFWMRANARGISSELHAKVDDAVDRSGFALVTIAFVAVGREGFETVLFLLGAETGSASGAEVVIGGLIGLGIAGVIGWLLYTGSERIDLKAFFNWTGFLLILFAAGLFAKGVHEFRELFELEGAWYSTPVWEITSGPFASGTFHDFMKGLFGWSADPERIRVGAYLLYLVPCLWFYFREGSGRSTSDTRSGTPVTADAPVAAAPPVDTPV